MFTTVQIHLELHIMCITTHWKAVEIDVRGI